MHNNGAGRVKLELIGTRVDVMVAGSGTNALEKSIRTAWDRCLAPDSSTPSSREVEVVLDPDPRVTAAALARGILAGEDELRVMSALTSLLTRTAIESRHGALLMLHACAMADPVTGAAVVLVAPSGTGKTTAAVALGEELGYLTDETTAIHKSGAIVPYPKPLSVLVDGQPPKLQTSPTVLGLLTAPPTPHLAGIMLLNRLDHHPVTPTVELVPTLEALPALAEQSSALQLLPRPLHLIADLLDRTGGLRRITYREVGDTVPLILELVRGGAQ